MADCGLRIRVRVSGPTFNTLFMVRVRVRVISGYDVMLNMCTAVRTNFKLLYDKFHPPLIGQLAGSIFNLYMFYIGQRIAFLMEEGHC